MNECILNLRWISKCRFQFDQTRKRLTRISKVGSLGIQVWSAPACTLSLYINSENWRKRVTHYPRYVVLKVETVRILIWTMPWNMKCGKIESMSPLSGLLLMWSSREPCICHFLEDKNICILWSIFCLGQQKKENGASWSQIQNGWLALQTRNKIYKISKYLS